jgi:hypothetical protein
MAQDDQFQQKLAATAKVRPQSSNPSSRPSGHKFEAIQERLNRQVSHVDKVLRTDSQPFSNEGRASNGKPSNNDVAYITRQSQPEPSNQMSRTPSYQRSEMF